MEPQKTYKSPQESRRQKTERITSFILFLGILFLGAIEFYLLKESYQLPFVNSIFFFGLMNLNIILIMLLLFLVFRNGIKLILEAKIKGPSSRLKTRLVFSFILFSIIPTILLFTISAFYIKNSFDQWFSVRIEGTLQKSIDLVKSYYETSEKNARHFSKKISTAIEKLPPPTTRQKILDLLNEMRAEYGLHHVEYYADPLAPPITSSQPGRQGSWAGASLESLRAVFSNQQECKILKVENGERIRCGNWIGQAQGAVFVEYFIPAALVAGLSEITLTYDDYKKDNPLKYPIKSTYFAILTMVTLLILFCATWTGFYVAKRLTVPLEELVRGTEQIALGNLSHRISDMGGDEFSRLISSFNKMVEDLQQNKMKIEETNRDLFATNQELFHRKKYIEVLLESVQSGVISLDDQGNITTVNRAAAQFLEIQADHSIGIPYWKVIPEELRSEFRDLLILVHGTSKPIRREVQLHNQKREIKIFLITMSVLRDENKKQLGTVAIFENVTDLQKYERISAWREVAKRIAHEIKNPLTPIQLSVQRLRRRYLHLISDDGTFGQSTDIILKEVDALKTLVGEFSSFARLPEIRRLPEDLNQIIEEVLTLFKNAHEKIQFVSHLEKNLPILELDRAQMKRVFINLLDNAIAAMSGDGEIQIRTIYAAERESVSFTITDEGCGISGIDSNHLFEPYFSTKQGGTGLGLTIVHHIITDHGGTIQVTPNHPNPGICFSIELPRYTKTSLHNRGFRLQEKVWFDIGVEL